MGTPGGEWLTPQGALEFKPKYHLNQGWGGGSERFLEDSKWFLGKMNVYLEEQIVGMIVCLDVVWTWLLSCDKSISSPVDETLREEIYDKWFLFGGSVREMTELRKSLCPHLQFFKCLRHRIIHMPKWHFRGWHIPSCSTLVQADSVSVLLRVPVSLHHTWISGKEKLPEGKGQGNWTEESNEK